MNQELHDELVRMGDEDARVRVDFLNHPPSATDPVALSLWDQIMRVDARHAVRFREIVATFGWPGRTLVGEDGAFEAWKLAQHVPRQDLARHYLDLLDAAVAAGDALPEHAAMLRDTVRIGDGEAPLLSPMSEWRVGERFELPLSNEERAAMDARRVAVGLPTLAEWARKWSPDVGRRHPNPLSREESNRRMREYYDQYAFGPS